MPEQSRDGTLPRRIHEPLDVGCANAGEDVRMNVQMEDGSTEWFDIHHTKVGRLFAGLVFASGVAARERPTASPLGSPLPQLSKLIDITSLNATSAPGEDFICLRLEVAPAVNLDFRIPIEALPAMQGKLEAAVSLAQSGKPSFRH
jgi:hypothetical protein